jgi:hypothetical protein
MSFILRLGFLGNLTAFSVQKAGHSFDLKNGS